MRPSPRRTARRPPLFRLGAATGLAAVLAAALAGCGDRGAPPRREVAKNPYAEPHRTVPSRSDPPRAAAPPPASRAPSALHVLAAPRPARYAFEPLAEPLRVEVFDQRGRPVVGAAVEWRVVRGGGRVDPAMSRTDSAGVAATAWAPGPTADSQTVEVSVPGVGAVQLRTAVVVAAVTVLPTAFSVWPGDSVALRADLADAAGHALAGGRTRWQSADSTTASVTADGVVVGVRAGTTHIVAESGQGSGSAMVTVRPVAAGRLYAADGGVPPVARVVVRGGGRTDSAQTAADGRFALRLLAIPDDDSVDVAIRPLAGEHHAATIRVGSPRELGDLRVVLVPTTWTVRGGSFDGRRVPVSPASAIARAGDGSRFWRLERVERRATWRPVGWQAAALPVRVAFRRGGAAHPVSPSDSAAFWRVASGLERDLGGQLFAPGPDPGEDGPVAVIRVVVDPAIGHPGYALASWNGAGAIGDATVIVRSAALLADAAVVTHELLHALGVGHTSAWPSVMAPFGGGTRALTASDAAHVQLLLRLRRVQEEQDAPYGVVEAAAAERGRDSAPALPGRRDGGRIP